MKLLSKEEFLEKLKGLERPSMADWFVKEFIAYETSDSKLLTFRKNETIDKTIYYDDEMEAPNVTLEYFKRYNKNNRDSYRLIEEYNENTMPYFIDNYCTDKTRVCVIANDFTYLDYKEALDDNIKRGIFQRYLTLEEIKEYNEIVEELRKKYDKRLEAYYKKYNKHITTYGYWANR